ncbi:hypothetical protein HG530_002948 [Fusarium avenaceum]|nr:hypothetical protein HG530_002948 [Fusarium avenaceum]
MRFPSLRRSRIWVRSRCPGNANTDDLAEIHSKGHHCHVEPGIDTSLKFAQTVVEEILVQSGTVSCCDILEGDGLHLRYRPIDSRTDEFCNREITLVDELLFELTGVNFDLLSHHQITCKILELFEFFDQALGEFDAPDQSGLSTRSHRCKISSSKLHRGERLHLELETLQ